VIESLFGLLGFVLCWVALRRVDWAATLHITEPAIISQAQWLIPLTCGMFMLNQPFSLALTALFSHQQIELASGCTILQSLALTIVFAISASCLPFAVAILLFFGGYVVTGMAFTVFLFYEKGWRVELPPFDSIAATLRSLLKPAAEFFGLSVCALISNTIGPVLVGAVAGIETAGTFSLMQRMFNLLIAVHLAALAPLSPSLTAHAHRDDWNYVRSKLQLCLRVVWPLLFLFGGSALVLLHPFILVWWSGKWMADYRLATLLAAVAAIGGLGNTYSIVLNSLGAVRAQAAFALVVIAPTVALPLWLGRLFGVEGVALAALAIALPSVLFLREYSQRVLRNRVVRV
jgi:O-antigen/teichoic acid export membrane protein